MRRLCRFVMVWVSATAVLTGCSGKSEPRLLGSPRLSVKDLQNAHTCPVDLAGAARAAGLKAEGSATYSVDSADSAHPTSGLGRTDGIEVECSQKLGQAGSIDFTLFAVNRGPATYLGLPMIMAKGQVTASDTARVATAAAKTPVGALVNLPALPGALGITEIKGKKSAIFTVFGVDRGQARVIANNIGGQLY